MGEEPQRVHLVGSPAIDGLDEIPALPDRAWAALGRPKVVFLMHPAGGEDDQERAWATAVLEACRHSGGVLAMHPNHDPGRGGIMAAIETAGVRHEAHLPRRDWVGLLKRVEVLVGNSSAGIIEAAALGVPVVNVGPRQAGRERSENVLDVPEIGAARVKGAIERARRTGRRPVAHPWGDGSAGPRAAAVLAGFDPGLHPLRKRNAF
jgi:UDP-N-acetylglucosamine 2-epimerase